VTTRRKLIAGFLAVGLIAGLTACFPSSRGAIDKLEAFALTLDGVSEVTTLSDEYANPAFPFGGNSIASVAVHLDGDDWRDDVGAVAESIRDWLATEQKDRKVDLSAAIVTPFGGVGVAEDEDETAERIDLLLALDDDEDIDRALLGYTPDGRIDDEDPSVTIARAEGADLATVYAAWQPRFVEFSPVGSLAVEAERDIRDVRNNISGMDPTLTGQHALLGLTTWTIDEPAVQWAVDADGRDDVLGWRVDNNDGAPSFAVAAHRLDQFDGLEAATLALPSIDTALTVSIHTTGLTVYSPTLPWTAARELAGEIADEGDLGQVSVNGATVFTETVEEDAVLDLVDRAAEPEEPILLDFTTPLGDELGSSGDECGCLEVQAIDADRLAEALPAALDLDRRGLGQLRYLDDGDIWANYLGEYNTEVVESFLSSVHDDAVREGADIQLSMARDSDKRFLFLITAEDRLALSDVFAGNRSDPDKRHEEALDIWNDLG